MMKPLRTSQIAKETGLHPNTIRLYEEWGFLPSIPRGENGYRLYTPLHLEQVRLTRLCLRSTFLSGVIRNTALEIINSSANQFFDLALAAATQHLELLNLEKTRAEAVAQSLQKWAESCEQGNDAASVSIQEAAKLLDITPDKLRNWERNGLISIPRNPSSGYREYNSKEFSRLRLIRALRKARYSIMSIRRMLQHFDEGGSQPLEKVLDTPNPEDDIVYFTDYWLTMVRGLVDTASQIIDQLELMKNLPSTLS